ncbi:MAG TPA: radical SAM protein [Dongiaceae bacterium]|nr:radical SAM protein [Dongiaceae bacterium]
MSASLAPPIPENAVPPCGQCPKKLAWSSIYGSLPAVRTVHNLDLDVTEACNLACIYCFKWQKKPVHMDEATAKSAIDWLFEASGGFREEMKVNFMGGEPLLRFDLIRKIVPYGKMRARQRGQSLHFGCTTNCTHLTDELMDFWRRFGMGFHCSIDGIPEVQNHNRPFLGGGPSSGAVEKNAPRILAYRPEVMARATVSPYSAPTLLASAKCLSELGFKSMTFKAAVNCAWDESDFAVLRSQYERLGDLYIARLVARNPVNIEEFKKGLQSIHSLEGTSHVPCGAGRGVVLVDPRGDLWPCHRFGPHQCAGQFTLGKFGTPFNDRLRDAFLRYNVVQDAKPDCRNCRAALSCRTWCYAECVDSTKTFYDPGREYCQAVQILHEEVLHIHDELRSRHPEILRSLVNGSRNGNPSSGERRGRGVL